MVSDLFSIQDISTNPILNGNQFFCYCTNFSLSGDNIVKESNKTAQPTYTTADGTGVTKDIKAYNRKKAVVQYASFKSPTITVDLLFKFNEHDTTTAIINGSTVSLLTLKKLIHFIRVPKTYYIKEDKFMTMLSSGENYYYSTAGIPVVIKSYTINITPGGNTIVSLTLIEDVDTTI